MPCALCSGTTALPGQGVGGFLLLKFYCPIDKGLSLMAESPLESTGLLRVVQKRS